MAGSTLVHGAAGNSMVKGYISHHRGSAKTENGKMASECSGSTRRDN